MAKELFRTQTAILIVAISSTVRHGKGEYLYKDGGKYSGDIVNGLFHGKGVEIVPSPKNSSSKRPSIYKGEFERGLRSGRGKMTYYNGGIYDGWWLQGKKRGFGKTKSKECTFEGTWMDGKRHGAGCEVNLSGASAGKETFGRWDLGILMQ
eukprot:727023_1